jgi:hypothetical protein
MRTARFLSRHYAGGLLALKLQFLFPGVGEHLEVLPIYEDLPKSGVLRVPAHEAIENRAALHVDADPIESQCIAVQRLRFEAGCIIVEIGGRFGF